MNTTIAVTKQVTTLINILTVEPENYARYAMDGVDLSPLNLTLRRSQ